MKLTEKTKMFTEYVDGVSKSELSRRYKISRTTLDRMLKDPKNADLLQSATAKKEEIVKDIFDYMDEQKEKVLVIMTKYLDALSDDDKISSATVNQLTTALGTLIDKWTMVREKDTNAEVRLAYIVEQDAPEAPPEEVEDEIIDE